VPVPNVPIIAYDSLADYLVRDRMSEKLGVEGEEHGKKKIMWNEAR